MAEQLRASGGALNDVEECVCTRVNLPQVPCRLPGQEMVLWGELHKQADFASNSRNRLHKELSVQVSTTAET